jgi:hypothetical protein
LVVRLIDKAYQEEEEEEKETTLAATLNSKPDQQPLSLAGRQPVDSYESSLGDIS